MTSSQPVTLTRHISASPESIYRAFTTEGGQLDWFGDAASVDARVGGRFYVWTDMGYQAMGSFTELEENALIAYEIFNPEPAQVRVTLQGENDGTVLTVIQSGLKSEDQRAAARAGWEGSLNNLKSVLETGLDRRVYDRPMLGILIGGMVDKENSARYSVPDDHGIIVSGTVKGMGAEAVGLQNDDVLVEMAGVQLLDYHALQQAVSHHKAGERVHITWYHQGEKREAEMTLSGRPVPDIPDSPGELADQVHQIYARLDAELAEILEGATQQQVEQRPGPNEWNALEILAHIILTERAAQMWVVNAAGGKNFKNWSSGELALVKSIVAIHPTITDLMAELQRTEMQTVALLHQVPPEVVGHRGAFHNIATMVGPDGMHLHTQVHYEMIRHLVAAPKAG